MTKLVNKNSIEKLARHLDQRMKSTVEQERFRAENEENNIRNKALQIEAMLDGRSFKYLTQEEYDALTEEEKERADMSYVVIDAVDKSHEHDNKAFLDSLKAGAIDASSLNGYILWTGTTDEYNAIATKDPETLYFITDAPVEELDECRCELISTAIIDECIDEVFND